MADSERFSELCKAGAIKSVVGDASYSSWAVAQYGGYLIDGEFHTTPDLAPKFRAMLEAS